MKKLLLLALATLSIAALPTDTCHAQAARVSLLPNATPGTTGVIDGMQIGALYFKSTDTLCTTATPCLLNQIRSAYGNIYRYTGFRWEQVLIASDVSGKMSYLDTAGANPKVMGFGRQRDTNNAIRTAIAANALAIQNATLYQAADSTTTPLAGISAYSATQAATTYDNFLSASSTPLAVTASDLTSGEVKFIRNGSAWSKVIVPVALTNYIPKTDIYVTISGKNLWNPALFDTSKYYSPGNNAVLTSNSGNTLAFTGYIDVVPGQTYSISGNGTSNSGGFFTAANAPVSAITFTAVTGGYKFTVPTGAGIARVGINYLKATVSPGTTMQLELGALPTAFVAYAAPVSKVDTSKLAVRPLAYSVGQPVVERVADMVQMVPKKNLVDTTVWNRAQYYSNGAKALSSSGSANAYARTGYIPVTQGGVYSVSGTGFPSNTGGYFNSSLQPVGTNITFSAILGGQRFTVPADTAIKYAIVNWAKQDTTVPKTIQIEALEIVTAYEPYQLVARLNSAYLQGLSLSGGSGSSGTTSGAYTDIHSIKYPGVWKKFPRFTDRWHSRDSDVVFAIWGTSMLARTTNTSFRNDATTRPPLADANNVFSLLVDKLQWAGQEYRRYDVVGGFFTTNGTFTDTYSDNAWDDGPYREGKTNLSTSANASVQFTVPVNAWQFNFIYRTDTLGTTAATVTIAAGNGLMEVFNGSAWVEANGYVFSMREPGSTANKGNTTFGKRLKMRCKSGTIDSRAVTKTVTIANTSGAGRFMYWGVEWSERRTMITFINAARGSHNFSSPGTGLPKYQDNELYSFKPDFILIELPTNNEGASVTSIPVKNRAAFTGIMENWIYSSSNAQSVYSRTGGFATTEIAMFNTTAAVGTGAIDTATKKWVFAVENGTGEKITVADVYRAVSRWAQGKDATTAQVNLWEEFHREAVDRFGTYYDALLGSGATGITLSKDGTHWNDVGCRTAAKYLLPLFDFN